MEATQNAVGSGAEAIVSDLLLQIIVIIIVSRLVAYFAKRFLGQTEVAGEILAGLLLGPSLLGAISPTTMNALFSTNTSTIFVGLAQLGLVLLMFQIGLEFEFSTKASTLKKTIIAVSLTGILVPFAFGFFTAPYFWESISDPRPPILGFRLFFGIAMSITAIPVLGRIFMELGLTKSRAAIITIGAAAIDDVIGWLLLGVISSVITSGFMPFPFFIRFTLILVFLGFIMFGVRRWLGKIISRRYKNHGYLDSLTISIILCCLFISAFVTSHLGIFAIIGGFILGVALHDNRQFVEEWKSRIGPLVNNFFLPLFFAYTGLRTDIGSLSGIDGIVQCLLVCMIAFVGKFGGAYISARITGQSHRDSLTIGVCMNTRALMELIALNIGFDLGVLPKEIFTMLVIMAIVSTYMATPLIKRLLASEMELEESAAKPSLSDLAGAKIGILSPEN